MVTRLSCWERLHKHKLSTTDFANAAMLYEDHGWYMMLVHVQGGVVVREGDVMPGTARGFALVGENSALLAATASGAVSCHTWPLQPSASGTLLLSRLLCMERAPAHSSDTSIQLNGVLCIRGGCHTHALCYSSRVLLISRVGTC